MAKYVVIYENVQKKDILNGLAPDLVKSHVEHLKDLHSQGVAFTCGPLKDCCGKGLLIFEANSLEEVESYVLKDPFIIDNCYASYRIYEWVEANESNNYLMDKY